MKFAVDSLRRFSPSKTAKRIANRFEVHEDTAWRDIAEARKLLAATAEKERPQIRAMETLRLQRIAEEAEKLAKKAAENGELLAASASHKSAISAAKEIARMNGAYAPDKVEVTQTVNIHVQVEAMIAILDERDLADMARIEAKLAAAKSEGRLALPEPEPEPDDDVPPGAAVN